MRTDALSGTSAPAVDSRRNANMGGRTLEARVGSLGAVREFGDDRQAGVFARGGAAEEMEKNALPAVANLELALLEPHEAPMLALSDLHNATLDVQTDSVRSIAIVFPALVGNRNSDRRRTVACRVFV